MPLANYKKLKEIGSGAFGDAILVEQKSDKKMFVMKVMKFSDLDGLKDCQAEVALMAELKHPNIVAYHDDFRQQQTIYLVMEYCSGGDLCQFIKDQKRYLPEQQIISWTLQILDALKYLHVREKPILHRDLKPENIFLTNKNQMLKIGDFGISRNLDDPFGLANTMCGTPLYICPEIYHQQSYNHKCDIWSLGCCVYELMTFKIAVDKITLIIAHTPRVNPMPSNYSGKLIDVVREMLSEDCTQRPSTEETIDKFLQLQRIINRPLPVTPREKNQGQSNGEGTDDVACDTDDDKLRRFLVKDSLLLYRQQPGGENVDFAADIDIDDENPVSTAERTLRSFGYKIINAQGQLRHISTGGPFKYEVYKRREDNETRYQEIAQAVTAYVWERLEKDHGMHRIYLPVDHTAGEPWTFIYVTPDVFTNDKLLILVTGPHPIQAGVWSRKVMISDSIDAGSQILWIRQAKLDGYAVLLLNPNLTYYEVDGIKEKVRDNSNSVEHAVYVWDRIITSNTKAKYVAFLTHRTGGSVTAQLAMKRPESFTQLVFAVGLCESKQHTGVLQNASKPVVDLFTKHSKHWVANSKPAGTALKRISFVEIFSIDKIKDSQISSGDERTEWAISASMDSAFEFLRKEYRDRQQ